MSVLVLGYREELETCPVCVAEPGCVYCLSTLQCQAADAVIPCPQAVDNELSCPVKPDCSLLQNCTSCAAADDCAYVFGFEFKFVC